MGQGARLAPSEYAAQAASAHRRPPLPVEEFVALFDRYENEKRKRRLVDFDDLLWQAGSAILDDPRFAAATRWRFRHLFVDEFQDVNPVQFRLLMGWLGDRLDLCVVGDPNQAIYSWNGADPTLLTRFTDHFPTAQVARLTDNFRSTPQVLAVANAVLADGRSGRGDVNDLVAHNAPGPVPSISSFATETDEARGIARLVRRRARREPPVVGAGRARADERAGGADLRSPRGRGRPVPGPGRRRLSQPAGGQGGDRRAEARAGRHAGALRGGRSRRGTRQRWRNRRAPRQPRGARASGRGV